MTFHMIDRIPLPASIEGNSFLYSGKPELYIGKVSLTQ